MDRNLQNLTRLETGAKKVLVLDLDETLVHCKLTKFDTSSEIARVYFDNQRIDVYISKRPGLEDFIMKMSKFYTLVLFTSGLKQYAEGILRALDIKKYFSRVLHREFCQLNERNQYEKNLSILGVASKNIILVDDSTAHIRNQPNNILVCKPFTGDLDDNELRKIARYLEAVATKKDVRPVMKNFLDFELRFIPEPDDQELEVIRYAKGISNSEIEYNFKQIDENQGNLRARPPKLEEEEPGSLLSSFRPYFSRANSVEWVKSNKQSEKESSGLSNGRCCNLVEKLPRMIPKSQYARLKGVTTVI